MSLCAPIKKERQEAYNEKKKTKKALEKLITNYKSVNHTTRNADFAYERGIIDDSTHLEAYNNAYKTLNPHLRDKLNQVNSALKANITDHINNLHTQTPQNITTILKLTLQNLSEKEILPLPLYEQS